MVWIVEWSQPDQYDSKVTAFATEADALSCACYDLMENVMNWDLSDPDLESDAKRINDYVMAGDYRNALRESNDIQADAFGDEAMYWHVYERQPIVGSKKPRTIIFQDADEEEEEVEEEEEIPPTAKSAFQATTPGATCRGPCGNYSPDAYADQSDGTFCSYQCKMMSQVFGGKVP